MRAAAALGLLLAGALLAAACQRPDPEPGAALPPAPDEQRSICERPARSTLPDGTAEPEASFHAFAKEWLETKEEHAAPATRVEIDGFETELRDTGDPQNPYVGTLRYCEHVLSCPDAVPANCTPARRKAITEIFRFEAGEWQR